MSQPQICLHDLIDLILRGELEEEDEKREEKTVRTHRNEKSNNTDCQDKVDKAKAVRRHSGWQVGAPLRIVCAQGQTAEQYRSED